jgi:hypothetical protein
MILWRQSKNLEAVLYNFLVHWLGSSTTIYTAVAISITELIKTLVGIFTNKGADDSTVSLKDFSGCFL